MEKIVSHNNLFLNTYIYSVMFGNCLGYIYICINRDLV